MSLSIDGIQHNAFSVIMMRVVMLSVAITLMFAKCRYAECRDAVKSFTTQAPGDNSIQKFWKTFTLNFV